MASLTITPASVAQVAGATTATGIAGETITAGMPVYTKAADGKYWKADVDTVAKNAVTGVSLHASLAGQPLTVQTAGSITIGATVAIGSAYYATATGGIGLVAEVSTGYTCLIGQATTAAIILLSITPTGVAHA